LTEQREKAKKLIVRKRSRSLRFLRTNWFKFKRVGLFWRKPRGIDSKIKKHLSGHPPMPAPGYRSPKSVRGLHPSGLPSVVVHNVKELSLVGQGSAIYIASGVGRRTREIMLERAKELKLKVLNGGEKRWT